MKRKGRHIVRQLILGLIALQILNLSVGIEPDADSGYDYSYSYNKTYDPTESAVEWIVELNYGQQAAFSYDIHEDAAKSPVKSIHWKTDLQTIVLAPVFFPEVSTYCGEMASGDLLCPHQETAYPPPEQLFA